MKKIIAVLLSALLLVAVFAVPASADIAGYADEVTISKGFAKANADYFSDRHTAGTTYSYAPNSQFDIFLDGTMRFKGGPATIFSPVKVTVTSGGATQVVRVRVYYEWYEHFVNLFAAGWFWIYAINNG